MLRVCDRRVHQRSNWRGGLAVLHDLFIGASVSSSRAAPGAAGGRASGGVEVVGQPIDDVVGAAQETAEYVRRSSTPASGRYLQQTATFTDTQRPVRTPTDLAAPRSGPSVPPLPTGTDISLSTSQQLLADRCGDDHPSAGPDPAWWWLEEEGQGLSSRPLSLLSPSP